MIQVVNAIPLFHESHEPSHQTTTSHIEFLRSRDIFHKMFKVSGTPSAEQAEYVPTPRFTTDYER